MIRRMSFCDYASALVSLFLITSTNTYLAISGVFGLTTFLQMWLAGLTAMAATWTALRTLWVQCCVT